jgi:glutathione S-transferase
VLIGLYEREVPFEPVIVDLRNADERAMLEALWPLAKFPVLHDEAKELIIPESSVILSYIDELPSDVPPLKPDGGEAALRVEIWDRVFDNYVELPMQKVIGDNFRPAESRDLHGVKEAQALLARSYKMLDDALARQGGKWIAGDAFTSADCSAAPALFYGNIASPFAGNKHVEAYFDRLLARPSFARVVDEARPYRHFFPLDWPPSYG